MDEVEEDTGDDMDGDGEEDGEGDDDEEDEVDDEDDERGRKNRPKKRTKLDPSVSSVKSSDKKASSGTTAALQTGEKRKRGRPRKIQTPPIGVEVPRLVLHPSSMQSQGQPPKYLLAVFALFNFFSNSPFPFTRESASQRREGTVLTHSLPNSISIPDSPWLSFQFVNSILSVLLLVFVLSDGSLRAKLRMPLRLIGYGVRDSTASQSEESHRPPRMGVLGLVQAAIARCASNVNAPKNDGDLRAWRPIAEAMVLDRTIGLFTLMFRIYSLLMNSFFAVSNFGGPDLSFAFVDYHASSSFNFGSYYSCIT